MSEKTKKVIKLEDAYNKLFNNEYLGYYSKTCVIVDEMYVFSPRLIGSKDDQQFTGFLFPAIDMHTGKLVEFSMLEHDLSNIPVININLKEVK